MTITGVGANRQFLYRFFGALISNQIGESTHSILVTCIRSLSQKRYGLLHAPKGDQQFNEPLSSRLTAGVCPGTKLLNLTLVGEQGVHQSGGVPVLTGPEFIDPTFAQQRIS